MSQFPVAHDSDGDEVPDAWDDDAETQEDTTTDPTVAANGHVAASSTTAAVIPAPADSDVEDEVDESEEEDSSDYATQVLFAYRKLQSRRVDLVGDYAGNELFIIDGDSLLLRSFSDPRLDFDPGFQLLHAVYNVEQVLQHLARRKCNFHVVFFRGSKTVCVPSTATKATTAKFLLARAAIIRHLQANLPATYPDIKIEEFPSYASPEFGQYLSHQAPYFVMAHDGAEATQRKGKHVPVGDNSAEIQLNANRAPLREMILFFIDQGYNVALLNGLEFRDTKAIAIVLERRRRDIQIPTSQSSLLPLQSNTGDDKIREALEKARTFTPHLTQRQLLAVIATSSIISRKSEQVSLARSFLEHESVLSHLPLSARRLATQESTAEVDDFLQDLSKLAETALYSDLWQEAVNGDAGACDLADFVDGRLYLQIHRRRPRLTDAIGKTFTELTEAMKQLGGIDLAENEQSKTGLPPSNGTPVSPAVENKPGSLAVMLFSNPVFDPHLATIRLEIDDNVARYMSSSQNKVFREVTHWHNAKKPIIQKGPPTAKSQKEEFWAKKRNQIFMGEMQKYAASLTNAVGRSLEPETIIVGSEKTKALPRSGRETPDSDDSVSSASKPKAPPKKAGGGKKGQQTAGKQAIMNQIAATKAKKDEAAGDKIVNAWHTVCKAIDAGDDPRAKFSKAKAHLTSLPSASRDVVAAECQLYMVSCLLQQWIAVCKKKEKEQHLELAALIWSVCGQVLSNEHLTKEVVSNVNLTVNTLGLPPVISKASDSLPARKLAFTFALPTTVHGISVGLPSKDFQLRYCGPYLERSFDSAPDPRVDFNPDGWQRKVLDAIDADKSVFAVAPTSAGKTFISFYAMRKVLEADDDSVLVYVAPTKALVNQIAAEIQARYSKKFKYGGKSVWAIHTRDYRINNPTGCQVLVTVPHVLQIMLLAPSNANAWSTRVKTIILDEIHSIGQADDGVVWEQLLLLSPCPIIALSATVGNPTEFSDWLTTTQKAIGVDLVTCVPSHFPALVTRTAC